MSLDVTIPPLFHEAGALRLEPWPSGGGVTLVAVDPNDDAASNRIGLFTEEAILLGQALVTMAWRLSGSKVIE